MSPGKGFGAGCGGGTPLLGNALGLLEGAAAQALPALSFPFVWLPGARIYAIPRIPCIA